MSIIFQILDYMLTLYIVILLLRSLTSWMRLDPYSSDVVRFLYILTEPLLEPIRAILPSTGMIDFSPLVAMILIVILKQILSSLATGR